MPGEEDDRLLLVLSAADVDAILESITVDELIENQSDAFVALSTAREDAIQAPLRTAVTTTQHTHLFMPCRLGEQTALKCVAVPTHGAPPGLPASGLYFDSKTGKASVLVNVSQLTAVRTAAGCLAASVAIQPSMKVEDGHLTVFGTGNQAKWHARLLTQFYGLKHVDVVTTSAQDRRSTIEAAWRRLIGEGIQLRIVESKSAAVYDSLDRADFVCCCTPSREPLFEWEHCNLRKDVHFSLIGSYRPDMQEVPEELIRLSAGHEALFVDSIQACSHEAGDLLKACSPASEWLEIGRSIAEKEGVDVSERISLFKSVGFALQDLAIMDLIVARAKERLLGQKIEFF